MMLSPAEVAVRINATLSGLDRALGLQLVSVSAELVEATLVIDDRHRQPQGLVHGGVYTSMVETLGSVGAWFSGGSSTRPVVGLDNHTSFVRAVREGILKAIAKPIHRGQRTQLWEVQIFDEAGRLAASGRLLSMVLDERNRPLGQS